MKLDASETCVGEDVDGQGVRFDRESLKELFILSFSLPTVGDVGVVSSDSDQAAVGLKNPRNRTCASSSTPPWGCLCRKGGS